MLARICLVLGTVAALAEGFAHGQVVLGGASLRATYEAFVTGQPLQSDTREMNLFTTANTTVSLTPGVIGGTGASVTPSAIASISFTAIDSTRFTGVVVSSNNSLQATGTNSSEGRGLASSLLTISFTPETPQYYRAALTGNVGATVMTGVPNGDPPSAVGRNQVFALDNTAHIDDLVVVQGNQTLAKFQVKRVYGFSPTTTSNSLAISAFASARATAASPDPVGASGNANGMGEVRFTTQADQFTILPQDLQDAQHTFVSGQWGLPMTTANQPPQQLVATGGTTALAIPPASVVAGSLAVDNGAQAILGAGGIIAPGAGGNILTKGGAGIVAPGAAGNIMAAGAGGGIIAPGAGGNLTNAPSTIVTPGAGGNVVSRGAGSLVSGGGGSIGGTMTLGDSGYGVNVASGGRLAPGNSPGRIDVFGNVLFEATSLLEIELGGTGQGTGHDFLGVRQTTLDPAGTGNLFLAGALQVLFLNGFENDPSLPITSFTIATADQLLLGMFDNVASGSRLTTADGFGSFLVKYSGNSVVLSNFVVPEPSSLALCAPRSPGWSTAAGGGTTLDWWPRSD